ncbi:uncharacterized protein LOC114575920 [Exaiptasia diaphana]|uniref:PHD-type domain-containing protein n=1 Tax=Exaiptasia diaphana TaxID=2652724 RepID=A0A913YTR8_EXADI|nr:uncharacterized protein LOC114575920 [Exaiptasia diaphana]
MKLPVVVFRVGEIGFQKLYVVEKHEDIDYQKMVRLIDNFTLQTKLENGGIRKETLRSLCNLASTESDRKLIQFAACEASKYSNKKAQNAFGIQSVSKLKDDVRNALNEAKRIREEVAELALVKEKSALRCLGFYTCESESSDSDTENETTQMSERSGLPIDWISDEESNEERNEDCSNKADSDSFIHENPADILVCKHPEAKDKNSNDLNTTSPQEKEGRGTQHMDPDKDLNKQRHVFSPNHDHLLLMLRENNLNWFSFVGELLLLMRQYSFEVVNQVLVDFSQNLSTMDLNDEEHERVELSRQAYLRERKQQLAVENKTGLTDSESDDPEDWVSLNLKSEKGKKVLSKQREIFKRLAKRKAAKEIAEKNLLKRKVPKKVSSILNKFPNIGKDIEDFVSSKRCGADSWRRTGVTTFDGNRKKGQKVSFRSIQQHLQTKYKSKIGYGTIVQLCVVRNKRKLSSKRYKGIAKVTCRRARKGFSLKFNPDAHYSCSMYKILDKLQLTDGTDKIILNRDDQAGFRLDTTYTHCQHKALYTGDQEVTTRTDFVNKYSSVLQTSSYLFMETATNEERAAGLVKNHYFFKKNPSQHASDLKYLKTTPEFKDDLMQKSVDCVRVDGATDERPNILEVQFLWTEVHVSEGKVCTCITARNSGGSFLNRVELVNGCIARAHSNCFIPSTLNGSNFDKDGLNEGKLKENFEAATEVYIDRVQDAPFGNTSIKFFKGANDKYATDLQERRDKLLVFLHGSKAAKQALCENNQVLYNYFEEIWTVRNNHLVTNLPEQYVFFLYACYKQGCIHPLCKQGIPSSKPKWFINGPNLSDLPLPIKDPNRPWGGECKDCTTGFCAGHYLSAEDAIAYVLKNGFKDCITEPPSVVLNKEFQKLKTTDADSISDDVIQECAKKTFLEKREVRMWFSHLSLVSKRRKAGAVKAAVTRKANKANQQAEEKCGHCPCGKVDDNFMIGCDGNKCKFEWFHYNCVGLDSMTIPDDDWYCPECSDERPKTVRKK